MSTRIGSASDGSLELYSGSTKVLTANATTGVANFTTAPTATSNGVATPLATKDYVDTSVLPPITYVTKSGVNSFGMLINGTLYTTAGTTAGYGNPNTGRGISGTSGQFGLDNLKAVSFPENTQIQKVGGLVYAFSYVLMTNGNLYTWGANSNGQCGLGHTNQVPTPILAATNVIEVYDHPSNSMFDVNKLRLFIKKADGYIYGAGYNGYGGLGLGDTTDRSIFTKIVSLGTDVIGLWNMGGDTGCVVVQKSDYKILVAGYNGSGQLGNGNTTNQASFIDVTSAWGGGTGKLLKKVIGGFSWIDGSNPVSLNASLGMLLDDGTNTIFRICGDNAVGQLGNGSTSGSISTPYTPNVGTGRIVDIAGVGSPNTVQVLKSDGTLYAWGHNIEGEVGAGTSGNQLGTPTIVTTGVTVLLSDGISSHTNGYIVQSAILKSDGLYMCGMNDAGYCGLGNTTNPVTSFTRTILPASFTVKFLGSYCTSGAVRIYIAVSTDNRIYAWGNNANNGVHATSTTSVITPVNVNTPRG